MDLIIPGIEQGNRNLRRPILRHATHSEQQTRVRHQSWEMPDIGIRQAEISMPIQAWLNQHRLWLETSLAVASVEIPSFNGPRPAMRSPHKNATNNGTRAVRMYNMTKLCESHISAWKCSGHDTSKILDHGADSKLSNFQLFQSRAQYSLQSSLYNGIEITYPQSLCWSAQH